MEERWFCGSALQTCGQLDEESIGRDGIPRLDHSLCRERVGERLRLFFTLDFPFAASKHEYCSAHALALACRLLIA